MTRFVQYIGASSGWHFVTPIFENEWNKEKTKARYELMKDWCLETFGEYTMGYAVRPEDSWAASFNDFMFKNENDAVMFILRWKGEF